MPDSRPYLREATDEGQVDTILLERFVDYSSACATSGELKTLIERCSRALGFEHFALADHADWSAPFSGMVMIHTYPAHWAADFIARGLYRTDPVFTASMARSAPFAWTELDALIHWQPHQREIMLQAMEAGIGTGYTIPANVMSGCCGSCSFATQLGTPIPSTHHLRIAHHIGTFAFEAARRLAGLTDPRRTSIVALTPRQRECVLWCARGKTDWEIGGILGISEGVVAKYIDAARKRYGVLRRPELIIRCLRDGQIGFQEVVEWG